MSRTDRSAPPAIILCGGRGSRIGGDKAFRQLSGRTLLAVALDRLAPQVGAIAINAPEGDRRLSRFRLPVIPDHRAGWPGPLAGIAAGLAWARSQGAPHVIVAPVDVPFLPFDFVSRLSAESDAAIAVASSGGHVHPVAGRFSVDLLDDAAAFLASDGRRSMMAWIDRHRTRVVPFGPQPVGGGQVDPFFNVNTPEDLAEAERLIGSAEPRETDS